ncbi:MAG: pilus assembly FimT family protein [Planctomycetota bacterium]|jgi:type II secretory pathway pseudopilin PulG
MKAKSRKRGLSLTEMLVVTACIAALVAFGAPAVRAVLESFESAGATRAMISAALASARATALKEQRYAGIRFQHAYDPDRPDPVDWPQYLVFIVHDFERTGLENGFRAVDGLKPIRLPDSVGVTDLMAAGGPIGRDGDFTPLPNGWPIALVDMTSFSIVFSPSGKLVIHDVRVRNRDGYRDSDLSVSEDDIFNKVVQVNEGVGMFYQDDYFLGSVVGDLGLGQEASRMGFYIYERRKFKQAYERGQAYTGYLGQLVVDERMVRVNAYTGRIISQD